MFNDRLEIEGDLLPTPEELEELNQYLDQCEREFLASQHAMPVERFICRNGQILSPALATQPPQNLFRPF